MSVEYDSLMKNNTWHLVHLPSKKKLVGCKWIYKTEFITNGKIEKHKAWLVAKGLCQQEGNDYTEYFSLVVKMNRIRNIISLIASYQSRIHYIMMLRVCF